jgi:hypothetical protein
MSNVIEFLETMGGDAAMARMSAGEYLAAVAALEAGDETRQALIARDSATLGEALRARPFMMCMVSAPGDGDEPPMDAPVEDIPETPSDPPLQSN